MVEQVTRGRRRLARLAALSCVLVLPVVVRPGIAAEKTGRLPVFQTDYGGTGLLETPTARHAPEGEFSFTYSHIQPYSNFAFSFQPFRWLQAGFRYTSISNRLYGRAIAGNRSYLDKGVDLKITPVHESRYVPEFSIGFRDLGGTGLFSSEYLVANKRWYNFDFSLGVAWGYLGSRGDLGNPLSLISSHFSHRVGFAGGLGNTGKFSVTSWFTGREALFGGIQYTTPWRPLTLQIEYDGNNYKHQPLHDSFQQKLPVNFGARLRLNRNVTLSAGFERGTTVMLGGTLSVNLAHLTQPKSDPAPVVPKKSRDNQPKSWSNVASKLSDNAGITVTRIAKKDHTLIVDGSPTTYRHMAQAELRGNRILHNAASSDISSFEYRWQGGGFFLRDDKLPRKPLPSDPLLTSPDSPFADLDYRQGVTVSGVSKAGAQSKPGKTLYEKSVRGFSYDIGPGLNYNYGGPDGLLYQALARVGLQYRTDQHGWASASVAYSLFDNLSHANYEAPSQLPRVRSDVVSYLKHTSVGVYNLQYTRTARLSDNVFGMVYGGLLEQMYGGVGGEVLYRPFNSRVAFGADVNWVKKRDYNTQFGFKKYSTVEGHATAYIQTGIDHILARLSVGRYLAKDYGTTIDLSKTFDSGVTLGAYAVFTSAGSKYGEGSFNKGIYLTMPLDIFFTKSSRDYVTARYTPLTRDGGASLNRRYTLYSLTGTRDLNRYWDGFKKDN
ncbi:YjbH domain-containing protein [Salinisphaera sp. LB1]|uniref:YjbH domain-containing protein n=1 Tax=Salinisphaera sp. LB1 TaxID=2183911 RepID=UPI000D7053F2|nr:YjbH domain-containing protein [Salinisphaera sp. LB1]AWN17543.1 Putative outer membrane lipoprotein YmcA [Salinisphaera sp. LB1]